MRHDTSQTVNMTSHAAMTPTDDEDVGAVEAHGTVLLDHSQRHQPHVRVLRPEGRQLLAKNVPVCSSVKISATEQRLAAPNPEHTPTNKRRQPVMNVACDPTAGSIIQNTDPTLYFLTHNSTDTRAGGNTHMKRLDLKASASRLMK
jgi:hypothetical protein